MGSNRHAKIECLKIFGPYDWMDQDYVLNRDNPLTFHHIIKKEYGGLATLDNGALISVLQHRILHNKYERNDPKIYRMLTDLFKELNALRIPPNGDYYQELDKILRKAR